MSASLTVAPLMIAIDGGLSFLRRVGIRPHFAVGDWDSLGSEPKDILSLSLPTKKDRSDLYYACRAAAAAGATDLICLGVTGGRPDHQLAMLLDLSEIEATEKGVRSVAAVDARDRYFFLSDRHRRWESRLKSGQLVSVLPLSGAARDVTLQGFQFSLKNAVLEPSSHGLSNRAQGGPCQVSVKKGRLVIMAVLP